MKKKTNYFFEKGKISVILDGGAGSSGKGKIGSYVVQNYEGKLGFVCNTFFPQASHTIVHRDNDGNETSRYVYKQLNSCAHMTDKYEKMYIGQGSVIDVDALLKEIEISGIQPHQLGISPVTTVLQDIDKEFEQGTVDFDGGKVAVEHDGTVKFGSTCSGVGAARARRVLRRPNNKVARDIPELKPYLCDVTTEISNRIKNGQTGLLEIAQGYQLSYGLEEFYPYTTSRNCTVAAGFDDMMLPVSMIGNVCINYRTYPIRIHGKKYTASKDMSLVKPIKQNTASEDIARLKETHIDCEFETISATRVKVIIKKGKHLSWNEVNEGEIPYDTIESYSGNGYEDQKELSWNDVTISAESSTPIIECTTLTKLPRRVFTPSMINIEKSIMANMVTGKIYLSLNFVNYVSGSMYKRTDFIDGKVQQYLHEYFKPIVDKYPNVSMKWLGTSEFTEDTIELADR